MKFEPGDLCFIVNGCGAVYPENIDRIVEVLRFIYIESGKFYYEIMTKGSPLMTTGGMKKKSRCSEMNLRLIPRLHSDETEDHKEKETT